MRDLLALIGAGTVCSVFALGVWVAACEASARSAARRAWSAQPARSPRAHGPVIGYFAAAANPHPLKHPSVHVAARSADEAWAAISRRPAL